jgi:hypothetical protein
MNIASDIKIVFLWRLRKWWKLFLFREDDETAGCIFVMKISDFCF